MKMWKAKQNEKVLGIILINSFGCALWNWKPGNEIIHHVVECDDLSSTSYIPHLIINLI